MLKIAAPAIVIGLLSFPSVASDQAPRHVETWRWTVDAVLVSQRSAEAVEIAGIVNRRAVSSPSLAHLSR